MTNTVHLHRVLRATPDSVYRAFLDSDALVKWLPPHGFTGKIHSMDARVGGGYRMSFTNFSSQKSHSSCQLILQLLRFDKPLCICQSPGPYGEVRLLSVLHGLEILESLSWASGQYELIQARLPLLGY